MRLLQTKASHFSHQNMSWNLLSLHIFCVMKQSVLFLALSLFLSLNIIISRQLYTTQTIFCRVFLVAVYYCCHSYYYYLLLCCFHNACANSGISHLLSFIRSTILQFISHKKPTCAGAVWSPEQKNLREVAFCMSQHSIHYSRKDFF